jgi:hypothetical protein
MSGIFENLNPIDKIKFIQNHGWEISEKDAEYFQERVGKLSFRTLVFLNFEKDYTAIKARKIKKNIPELYGFSDWRFLNKEDCETFENLLKYNYLSLPDLKIWTGQLHFYCISNYYAYFFDTKNLINRWEQVGWYGRHKIMFVW